MFLYCLQFAYNPGWMLQSFEIISKSVCEIRFLRIDFFHYLGFWQTKNNSSKKSAEMRTYD